MTIIVGVSHKGSPSECGG